MDSTHTIFIRQMLDACEKISIQQWDVIKPHVEHELRGLLMKLDWINNMKLQNAITAEQARIHIDIQKNTMRTRLMALPNITMIDAEHIINEAIDSVRKQLYDRMDWVII